MKTLNYSILCSFLLIGLVQSCTQDAKTNPVKLNIELERSKVNTLMDNWHHAAAVADEEIFFGSMTAEGIYLGTDKTEKWKRDEMKAWSSKYFERDTAWAFTPYDREIYFSEEGTTAWFDELLETWMGPCRGSGICRYEKGTWKLAHYNLAMLIDNDDVNSVIELIQARDAQLDSLPNSQ